MQVDRLKILEKYAAEEPNDPFNHYALALELLKTDQSKALEKLTFVLDTFPEYLASYYQLGIILTDLEKYKEAILTLEKGILLAEKLKNSKTKKELEGALQIALNESEEW